MESSLLFDRAELHRACATHSATGAMARSQIGIVSVSRDTKELISLAFPLSNHAAVPGIPFKVYAKGCKRKGYLPADFGDQALFSTLVYLRAILIFAYRGLNSAPPENLLAALQEIVERSAGEEAVRRSRVQAGLT